jgi:hypothetical protein
MKKKTQTKKTNAPKPPKNKKTLIKNEMLKNLVDNGNTMPIEVFMMSEAISKEMLLQKIAAPKKDYDEIIAIAQMVGTVSLQVKLREAGYKIVRST